MIALKCAMFERKKSSAPTARDYVQDGLIAMWDGEWNAGWGNSLNDGTYSISTWVPLVGQNAYTSSWNSKFQVVDGRIFTYANLYFNFDANLSKPATVELTWAKSGQLGWWCNRSRFCSFNFGDVKNSRWLSEREVPVGAESFADSINKTIYRIIFDGSNYTISYGDGTNRCTIPNDAVTGSNEDALKSYRANCGSGSGSVLFECPLSARVYSRALTASEIAANYAVDKARFNLA